MKTLRAGLVIFVGFLVYVSALATVDNLSEIYGGIVADKEKHKPAIEYLDKLSENELVQQGLSWILATFAAIAVAIFSREREESSPMDEQVESQGTSGKKRQRATESAYLKRQMAKYDKLKGKHAELRSAYNTTARRLFKTQSFARRQLRSALVLSTALFFAVSCLVAAGFQALVKSLVNESTFPEPLQLLATYPQTLALCISAFFIPFIFYRRYLRIVRLPDFKSSFVIGFVGILAPSLFGFLVEGPETWSLLLSVQHEQIGILPYFGIQMISFLALTRLVVFPLVGLIACWAATVSMPQKRNPAS